VLEKSRGDEMNPEESRRFAKLVKEKMSNENVDKMMTEGEEKNNPSLPSLLKGKDIDVTKRPK
jgi:hypothetical protein